MATLRVPAREGQRVGWWRNLGRCDVRLGVLINLGKYGGRGILRTRREMEA